MGLIKGVLEAGTGGLFTNTDTIQQPAGVWGHGGFSHLGLAAVRLSRERKDRAGY